MTREEVEPIKAFNYHDKKQVIFEVASNAKHHGIESIEVTGDRTPQILTPFAVNKTVGVIYLLLVALTLNCSTLVHIKTFRIY